MSWKRVAIGLGLAIVATSVAVAAGAVAGEEPVYFVGGARPDLTVRTVTGEIPDRCVQYSADRPDVWICGPVPEGWQPPPIPYHEGSICDAALDWLKTNDSPTVDVGSCLVNEGDDSMWNVVFRRADGNGNVAVPFDPSGTVAWAAHP